MSDRSEEKLNQFFRALAGAPRALLLLDYDGTLAGFRIDRFKARPWAGVPKLLAQIQRQRQTRVAVITGRSAAEIAPMLTLDPPLEVWGLHGAERLYPDGRHELETASPLARTKLNELRERLGRDPLGGLFESKANAVVMHWRGRSPQQARAIERRARELFEPLAELDGLALMQFEAGLELRVGRNKGGAVREILSEEAANTPVAFLGDDLTDESAFLAVNETTQAHLSVLVRRETRTSAADIWLQPPEELRGFLKRWLRAAR